MRNFVYVVRKYLLFLITLITLFVLVSCGRNGGIKESRAPAELSTSEIKRIISAAPSNTEIIVALGLADKLIAIDPYSIDVLGVPKDLIEIDFFYPDTEAVIGLEPDLIFVNEVNSFGVANNPFKILGDVGIRVVDVRTSTSIEGICNDIIFIAETLGVKEKGEAIVKSMQDEIKSISAAGERLEKKKTVYFEVSAMPSIVTFGQDTYLNEMIQIAGGINIFAEQKGWFSPSEEQIINRDPDLILTLFSHGVDPVSEIMGRKAFNGLSAVKQNQVISIDTNSAARPSHNILLALREMTKAINPSYYETAR